MAIVHLDYGHGGKDPGAIGNGLREKDLTLQIGQKIYKILIDHDVAVSRSRTSDIFLNLSGRARLSNQNKADLFVSIHINSFTNASANGVETFSYPGSREGARVAKLVQNELIATKLFTNRGTKTANFAVLRETRAPAILVELGFISNTNDANILKTKQNELAEAVAKGLLKAVGVKYRVNKPKPPKPKPTLRPKPKPDNNLRHGSRGKEVTKLQRDLKELGYDVRVRGGYGKEVEKAVTKFQSRHLGVRRSGEADETTLRMIENDLKAVQFYKDNK